MEVIIMAKIINDIIKKIFKDTSTEGIGLQRKMLECRVLSKSFPVEGELPMEMIENQLHDVYEYIKSTITSVRAIIKDDSEASTKYMTAKNAIMHGMKGIVENKHDSLILCSICEAYIEANTSDAYDLIIPTYEECLKVYESKFMNQKLWNYNGGNFMMTNFEVNAKINEILKNRDIVNGKPETAWSVLVNNKIFSRGVPVPRATASEYEEDWSEIMNDQANYLKEFVASSVRLGLGIPPLNEEGSIIALAVYNAAMDKSIIEEGLLCIPSKEDIYEEFFRLMLQQK